jgi:putative DNA primase/helicase
MNKEYHESDIMFCKNCKSYNFNRNWCELENIPVIGGHTCELFEKKDSRVEVLLNTQIGLQNYLDNVEQFWKYNPFFYDRADLFWFWDNHHHKWGIVDPIDLMNSLESLFVLRGQTVRSGLKNDYMEAFKRVGRVHIPSEAPKYWIQFKDQILDLKTGNIFQASPEYFLCNPIPWKLGESEDTPTIDQLFESWVGKGYVDTLYEIMAYCCLTDYPIHLIFCFIGIGSNGKSKFQKLLTTFIGSDNTCSTELDTLLDSRFESTKLHKKLVCLLGETNFGMMNKTSLLKKLTGQDLIGFEYKNKSLFDDYNYAKILISSNSLPSSEDTSEGFYRRWLILDFPNRFEEGKDILETIPQEEYNNLARKITNILPRLLNKGKFTNQGSIEDRRERYIMSSNPLPLFLNTYCDKNPSNYVRLSELYLVYTKYLTSIKKRIVSKQEFNKSLLHEGYETRRTSKKVGLMSDSLMNRFESDNWVEGIKLKEESNV